MERISLDAYKIFCRVIDAGSISAAAKEMYMTQPAVSMAVKQLENQLGKPLFNRLAKGVSPTPEGEMLYTYLRQAFSLIETGEEKYRAMANLQAGEVKIGAGDTILSHFLLPYIDSFTQCHPGIVIKATNRTTNETVKSLRAGSVDMGFINLPLTEDDRLEITQCLTIHDCLVGGEKFAHLAEHGINIAELCDYPLMLLENESNSRQYLNEYASSYGVRLNPGIELGSYDLLLQFAEINMGLTFAVREFLPASRHKTKTGESAGLVEIPLIPEIPERHIGLVKLKGVLLSAAAEEFKNAILAKNASLAQVQHINVSSTRKAAPNF